METNSIGTDIYNHEDYDKSANKKLKKKKKRELKNKDEDKVLSKSNSNCQNDTSNVENKHATETKMKKRKSHCNELLLTSGSSDALKEKKKKKGNSKKDIKAEKINDPKSNNPKTAKETNLKTPTNIDGNCLSMPFTQKDKEKQSKQTVDVKKKKKKRKSQLDNETSIDSAEADSLMLSVKKQKNNKFQNSEKPSGALLNADKSVHNVQNEEITNEENIKYSDLSGHLNQTKTSEKNAKRHLAESNEQDEENNDEPNNKSKKDEKYKNKRNRLKKQKLPEKKFIFTFDENHPAIVYLSQWKNDKQNWTFKKARQTWLLHHMYNEIAIPDEYFSILMEYLSGSKGGARTKTLSDAELFFNKNSENENDDNESRLKRCREVIQHLS